MLFSSFNFKNELMAVVLTIKWSAFCSNDPNSNPVDHEIIFLTDFTKKTKMNKKRLIKKVKSFTYLLVYLIVVTVSPQWTASLINGLRS